LHRSLGWRRRKPSIKKPAAARTRKYPHFYN
jgi:hypothetical protein